eukprot:2459201-Lingulodinium_polyedra.AAC.1
MDKCVGVGCRKMPPASGPKRRNAQPVVNLPPVLFQRRKLLGSPGARCWPGWNQRNVDVRIPRWDRITAPGRRGAQTSGDAAPQQPELLAAL